MSGHTNQAVHNYIGRHSPFTSYIIIVHVVEKKNVKTYFKHSESSKKSCPKAFYKAILSRLIT